MIMVFFRAVRKLSASSFAPYQFIFQILPRLLAVRGNRFLTVAARLRFDRLTEPRPIGSGLYQAARTAALQFFLYALLALPLNPYRPHHAGSSSLNPPQPPLPTLPPPRKR